MKQCLTIFIVFLNIFYVSAQINFEGVISFSSDRDGDNEIYLMHPNSTELIKLTDNVWDDVGHGWSPDGSQIAFSSNRDGNYEIYVMNADGSDQTRKTFLPYSYDFQPRWSPDGSKLVFTGEDSNNAQIFELDLTTLEVIQLTNFPVYHASPGYSPDGNFIVFDSQRTGHADIYIMEADGTNIQNYSNTLGIHEISPMWSPVENKIAFQKEVGEFWEIVILDLNNNTIGQLTQINADNQQPAWSNDGSQIVFMTRQDPGPNHEISIIDTTGNNLYQLTNNTAQDWYPAFQADSATDVEQILTNPIIHLFNYPNPFNSSTTLYFETTNLLESAQIEIYNLKGRKVRTFSNHQITHSLNHQTIWNGTDQNNKSVSSGVYYVILKQNNTILASKKMILMK